MGDKSSLIYTPEYNYNIIPKIWVRVVLVLCHICIYIIIMEHIHFEWDDNKNKTNIKKYNISFEEAKTVFLDPEALLIHDPEHSEDEDRFIILGLSRKVKILVVCHCYKASDSIIRIISARKADKQEEKEYGEGK